MGIAAISTAAVEIIQVWTTACRRLRWSLAVLLYLIRFHPEKARASRTVSALFVLSKKKTQTRRPRGVVKTRQEQVHRPLGGAGVRVCGKELRDFV